MLLPANYLAPWQCVLRRMMAAFLVVLCAASPASTMEGPELDSFRSALRANFGLDTDPAALTETALDKPQVSAIVMHRLPKGVRAGLLGALGMQFRVGANGGDVPLRFGVLTLAYSDPRTAAAKVRLLGDHGYLRQTKIATPYCTHVVGERVFIAFTESAGSKKAVAFVGKLPSILRQ